MGSFPEIILFLPPPPSVVHCIGLLVILVDISNHLLSNLDSIPTQISLPFTKDSYQN